MSGYVIPLAENIGNPRFTYSERVHRMEKELAGINKRLFGNNDETLISLIDSGINSRPERGRTDILCVSNGYRSGFLSRPAPHRTSHHLPAG